jgi:hypothetical protein
LKDFSSLIVRSENYGVRPRPVEHGRNARTTTLSVRKRQFTLMNVQPVNYLQKWKNTFNISSSKLEMPPAVWESLSQGRARISRKAIARMSALGQKRTWSRR